MNLRQLFALIFFSALYIKLYQFCYWWMQPPPFLPWNEVLGVVVNSMGLFLIGFHAGLIELALGVVLWDVVNKLNLVKGGSPVKNSTGGRSY